MNNGQLKAVLSFDVEEHWRIEAASGLSFDEASKSYYAGRVAPPTHWILDELERYGQRAKQLHGQHRRLIGKSQPVTRTL